MNLTNLAIKGICLPAILALSACTTFSKDGGFSSVEQAARTNLGKDIVWTKSSDEKAKATERVQALLLQPLDVENAVQVALLNNKSLQAAFADLGVSEADLVQAGQLPNPRFSMLYAKNGGEYKIEQVLTFNIFSLVTIPKAEEIEQYRFEQAKQQAILKVLGLAHDVRVAYFNAVATNETLRYAEQVKSAAETGHELSARMLAAGNWSRLDHAREHGFYTGTMLDYSKAQIARTAAHEKLVRLLGLSGEAAQLKLSERLPDLPKAVEDLPDVEKTALEQRIDLRIIKADTETLAKSLGLTRTTRLINVLELGPARVLEGERHDAYKNGMEIAFELPLFDWGDARVARAESQYMQAVNQAAQAVVNARSEVREAYAKYRATYDVAKYYRDEVVPVAKRVSEENLLRYNGMLVGVFDLLADARAQISSVQGYMEALREFWVSQSNLQMAMTGRTTTPEGGN